ncbi:hypothetical protein HY311_04055 [Candidatus Nomurabacteria bacterium]|nr:hypothetical protein [Candidatus Nomurabacteria bacterium]
MKFLQEKLKKLINNSKQRKVLEEKLSIGDFELIFVSLLEEKLISYKDYLNLRSEYKKRNKNLNVIKITAPRTFGKWGEDHIESLIPELRPGAEVKSNGEFDLYYKKAKGIVKIEVKAGRAIDRTNDKAPYHERALISTDKTGLFDMNFQQMKPTCFDAVIMVGVWADKFKYWLLTPKQVKENRYFSTGQHRGNKGYEGQLHIKTENISEFSKFEIEPGQILKKIKKL